MGREDLSLARAKLGGDDRVARGKHFEMGLDRPAFVDPAALAAGTVYGRVVVSCTTVELDRSRVPTRTNHARTVPRAG